MTDLTDEEIANAVRANLAALCANVRRAAEAGIAVRIDWIETSTLGDPIPEYTPSVEICKKL